MNPELPTHYEILGLGRAAPDSEIKKRYRELARRYHPDVAKNAGSEQKFRQINEAYRVLSDPQRRKAYDSELKLADLKKPANAQSGKVEEGERGRQGNPGTPGTTDSKTRRSNTNHPKNPTAQPPNSPTTQRPSPSAVDSLIAQAEVDCKRMRFREAEDLCRQALRYNRRVPGAYEVLGDIHLARRRTDEAVAMYSYALQLDPMRLSVRKKFDKLTGQKSGATMAGHAAEASRHRPRATRGGKTQRTPGTREVVTGFGVAMIGSIVVLIGLNPASLAPSVNLLDWDPLLVLSLAWAGLTSGFLMAFNERIGIVRAELGAGRGSLVPLGAVLFGFALLSFYAALAVYLAIGFVRNTLSRSVLTAFGICFGLTCVFALVLRIAGLWVFVSGGNLLFAGFVLGWTLADRVKDVRQGR